MNKRRMFVHIFVFFIMSSALLGSNFIKLEAIWGETTLCEALSLVLFPYLMMEKISYLANRFVDWLFKLTEE